MLEAVEAPWKEEREAGGGLVVKVRKVRTAPARLLKRAKEQRRHLESTRTLQELRRKKRMREACEEAAGVAAKRRCKAGGFFPQGLITQVAAGRVAQSRAVTERLNRRQGLVSTVSATEQVAVEAMEEGGMVAEGAMAGEGAAEGGTVEGAVVTQEEEQMV